MQSWIHVLEWRATVHPDVPALIDDRGTRLTYRELLETLERRAGGWHERGVRPGDVVALVGKNSADFLVNAFALMRAGAIPAFINWRLAPREVTELFALLEPVAVAADAEFVPLLDEAAPGLQPRVLLAADDVGAAGPANMASATRWVGALEAEPPERPELPGDAVMTLVHTSGTTGRPKAIPLRHGALIQSVAAFAIEIGDQVAGSRHLQIMPLFHLGGFGQAMQVMLTAGSLYVHTSFGPSDVVDAIERDRLEFFTAGPSLVDMLVAEVRRRGGGADLSSLVEIAYGSAPITPASLRRALETFEGCRFRQIYGNTESQSMISLLAPEDHRPELPELASAGRVAFGWEVKIVDAKGEEVAVGEPGELLIRGECLFSGYWRDEEATREAFADGGWYRTGDIARLTPGRYLYILDRAKDMIISGGENIYPAEVEAVLAAHPSVRDVAVIGRPDATWGEAVHAVIIPAEADEADAAEITSWCRERLAGFKIPKSFEFVEALPRTTTGKVLKRELRARARA
ncbi:AMP-binding protein [Actinomadura barringtoniae]|uniref:AMP-binding protein n=1 Tax=Actinomadura barringtoniae TaxID=1427535 RepID=A0A939PH72_9ACTN|nr:AMP-binding protein [Actinomadura barringtoniae]MBO2449134.1 AMP-binding protein [Actinomadura barringtoniae]